VAFRDNIGNKVICIMIAMTFLLIGPLSIVSANVPSARDDGRPAPMASADDWPNFRYGANRNGVTTSHGPTKANLYWSNTSSGAVYSSPAVGDGKLFFGSDDGNVYAFDALTGKRLWSNSTSNGNYGASSSPAVSNGFVFIYSNNDDNLYCFNVSTGARKWMADLGSGNYGGSSPLVINSKVYVGSSDGYLYVRDENTGAADWNYAIGVSGPNGYGVESGPAVVGDRVFFGGGDSKFYAVNTTSHALVWSYSLASYGYPSASVIGNVVYTADGSYASSSCANCKVYAFDKDGFADGNDGWAGEALTGGTNGDIIWNFSMTSGTTSSPTYYKGYIFIGSMDNKVYALNSTTGTLKWSYTTGADVMSSASISDDIVYIGSSDSKLYAFDYDGFADGNDGWTGEALTGATNGDIIFNYTLSGQAWASPSISNGIIYITDLSNKIWAIGTPYVNPTTPQVLSTSPGNLATNVSLSTVINAHLSQVLDWTTVTTANFTLKDNGGNPVAGTVSSDVGKVNITFNPGASLKPHEKYSASIMNIKNSLSKMIDKPYNWTFTTINALPVLSVPAFSPATGDLTTTFQFKVLYADPDNDAPSGGVRIYLDAAITPKTCIVNTSASPATYHDGNYVNGEEYIYNTTFTTAGVHTYQFKVSDGFIETSTAKINGPQVIVPNQPPVIGTIPDQHVTEDVAYIFPMGAFVTDPDNTTAQLKLSATSQYITGITGLNVSLLFPQSAPAQVDIEFTVTDGVNPVLKTVRFIVTYVDDVPILSQLPDVNVNASQAFKVNVAPYISDVDTPLSGITVTTNSSYVTVSGLNLTLNYPRTVGKELVNVSVKDATTTVHGTFWVTVYAPPINLPPTIDTLPDATPKEDEVYTYDLTTYVDDDGLPSGTLTISIKQTASYVTLNGMKLTMLYPDGITSYNVNITASDGALNTTAQLHVRVTPVNDAPDLKDGGVLSIFKGKDKKVPTSYVFNVTVGDVDGPDPIVWVYIDNASNQMTKGGKTTMTIGGKTVTAYYYTLEVENTAMTKGIHNYRFKVDDRSATQNSVAETATANFEVTKVKKTQLNPMAAILPYLLIVVIIIVVLVVVAVMLMRRKKKPQAMPPQGQPQQADLLSGGVQQAPFPEGPATPPPAPEQPVPQPPVQPPQQPPIT